MFELKELIGSEGKFVCKCMSSMISKPENMIKEVCEKNGLVLITGKCYDSQVAEDIKGNRFALIPRSQNLARWVEYTRLRSNQKLE